MMITYHKLINSDQFRLWKDKHKNAYLCSCFTIFDNEKNNIWQFDYYLPRINKITSFIVENKISIQENQRIFGRFKKKLNKINLEEIRFTSEQSLNLINKKYKDKIFNKKIIILQKLDYLAWNISLVTNDFNLINLKINASNGKIMEETSSSLLQFKVS